MDRLQKFLLCLMLAPIICAILILIGLMIVMILGVVAFLILFLPILALVDPDSIKLTIN